MFRLGIVYHTPKRSQIRPAPAPNCFCSSRGKYKSCGKCDGKKSEHAPNMCRAIVVCQDDFRCELICYRRLHMFAIEFDLA